jgi:hypothetical protein
MKNKTKRVASCHQTLKKKVSQRHFVQVLATNKCNWQQHAQIWLWFFFNIMNAHVGNGTENLFGKCCRKYS